MRSVRLAAVAQGPSAAGVYHEHADFVWATLFRMGVPEADLPDHLQDVFIVVHRRLSSYDPDCRMTSWLYGICRRVVAGHRRRAHVRRERVTDPQQVADLPDTRTPEHEADLHDRLRTLNELLGCLSVDRRVAFVMFELEERSCAEIAAALDVPIGTVYSRLHAARNDFQRACARLRAREGRGRVHG